MRRLIYALEQRLLRGYQFVSNVAYYYGLGYSISKAIHLARRTL